MTGCRSGAQAAGGLTLISAIRRGTSRPGLCALLAPTHGLGGELFALLHRGRLPTEGAATRRAAPFRRLMLMRAGTRLSISHADNSTPGRSLQRRLRHTRQDFRMPRRPIPATVRTRALVHLPIAPRGSWPERLPLSLFSSRSTCCPLRHQTADRPQPAITALLVGLLAMFFLPPAGTRVLGLGRVTMDGRLVAVAGGRSLLWRYGYG
jgi:hypothetical protein